MGLFGPSYQEVWSELSEDIGASFEKGGVLKTATVNLKHEDQEIILDQYTVSTGQSTMTYTRVRCKFHNQLGINLKVYKKSIFSKLAKKLHMQDIIIGYPDFDSTYTIKGNDEAVVKRVFYNTYIRETIFKLNKVNMVSKKPNKKSGISDLEYLMPGVIKDKTKLNNVFDLFKYFIEQYIELGIIKC